MWTTDSRQDLASILTGTNTLVVVLPLLIPPVDESQLERLQIRFSRVAESLASSHTYASLLIVSPSTCLTSNDVSDILQLSTLSAQSFTEIHIWNVSEDSSSYEGVPMPDRKTFAAFSDFIALHAELHLMHAYRDRSGHVLLSLGRFIDVLLELEFFSIDSVSGAAQDAISTMNQALDRAVDVRC